MPARSQKSPDVPPSSVTAPGAAPATATTPRALLAARDGPERRIQPSRWPRWPASPPLARPDRRRVIGCRDASSRAHVRTRRPSPRGHDTAGEGACRTRPSTNAHHQGEDHVPAIHAPAPPPAWPPPGEWPLPSRAPARRRRHHPLHRRRQGTHDPLRGGGHVVVHLARRHQPAPRDIPLRRAGFSRHRAVQRLRRGGSPAVAPAVSWEGPPTAQGRQRSAAPGRTTRATGGPGQSIPAASSRTAAIRIISPRCWTRRHGQVQPPGAAGLCPMTSRGPTALLQSAPASMLGGHRGSRQNWLIWARRALSAPDNRAARIRRSEQISQRDGQNPIALCDDHAIGFVTVTGQILMAVHTLRGYSSSSSSSRASGSCPAPAWASSSIRAAYWLPA